MQRAVLSAIILISIFLETTMAFAKANGPAVVVSIKPIHSLVAGVMEGIAQPTLLVAGGGSPHGYVLRPSEARALANADLVIWVGHTLETFLEKPLGTLSKKARTIEVLDLLPGDLLPARSGGQWDEQHDELHHGHEAGDANPHVWLNPRLATKIVVQTAQVLSDIDPENSIRYKENASHLQQKLEQLDKTLTAKLAPVQALPYIVFHDAYQYFEDAYQLNPVGSLTVNPERKPGAKRILEIRKKIQQSGALCVFSEPQFEPRLIVTLTEGTDVRTGVLDPLGTDLPVGTESYFLLMNNLADSLVKGLR